MCALCSFTVVLNVLLSLPFDSVFIVSCFLSSSLVFFPVNPQKLYADMVVIWIPLHSRFTIRLCACAMLDLLKYFICVSFFLFAFHSFCSFIMKCCYRATHHQPVKLWIVNNRIVFFLCSMFILRWCFVWYLIQCSEHVYKL